MFPLHLTVAQTWSYAVYSLGAFDSTQVFTEEYKRIEAKLFFFPLCAERCHSAQHTKALGAGQTHQVFPGGAEAALQHPTQPRKGRSCYPERLASGQCK